MDEIEEDGTVGAETLSTSSTRGLGRLSLSIGSIMTNALTIALSCIFTYSPCASLLFGVSIDSGCFEQVSGCDGSQTVSM